MKYYFIMLLVLSFAGCCNCGKTGQKPDNMIRVSGLELSPYIESMSDEKVVFAMKVKRLYVEEAYLPTSEEFRVEIGDASGNIIWSSAFGKNFLQILTPLKPENIDGVQTFSLEWNGKNNSGKDVPAGNYKAFLILPSKPKPYTASIDFAWK
jgi:hypothetical protein